MDENRQSEQRVNFFLAVTSAAIGALALLSQPTTPNPTFYSVASIILLTLLLFGLTILNRLNSRTALVKAFRHTLADIQSQFASQDADIASYLERQKKLYETAKKQNGVTSFLTDSLCGGLADIMILANGLICGAIITVLLSSAEFNIIVVIIGAVGASAGAILLLYLYRSFIMDKLPLWPYY